MTTEPCTCARVPVRSSLEKKPGAKLVDATDAKGRWHAVQVGKTVYLQSLVAPVAPPRRAIVMTRNQGEIDDALALERDPEATDAQRAWAADILRVERAAARERRSSHPPATSESQERKNP